MTDSSICYRHSNINIKKANVGEHFKNFYDILKFCENCIIINVF